MKLVSPVADGVEVVAAFHQRVYAIVHRNKADALLGKVQFRILSHLQILSPQAAEILDDEGRHLITLNHLDDLFPCGTVKVRAGVSIISEEKCVFKSVFTGVFFKKQFLIVDGVGLSLTLVLLTESAIKYIDSLACHYIFTSFISGQAGTAATVYRTDLHKSIGISGAVDIF